MATWPLVLAPASSWPDHHDPALFTWVMATTARRLLHAPGALFHGNAFYPYGLSLAFSESLLVPALLGFPGFVAGNPVLTYNLLVLLFWPVNGVAMAWAAHEVTGSRSAAWLAGAVFSLSPYFTEYHLEFNMLPAARCPSPSWPGCGGWSASRSGGSRWPSWPSSSRGSLPGTT